MVKIFLAVTDWDWFRFLRASGPFDEINFWQPGGNTAFKAISEGELFLFKLHAPRNYIAGGGVFSKAVQLPLSLAWEAFGVGNGAPSLLEMRRRIARYRRTAPDEHTDFVIGCRFLEQPFFFDQPDWFEPPDTWSRNIVVGKTFDTDQPDGLYLWQSVQERLTRTHAPYLAEERARYGSPTLIAPRLGQSSFRIAVIDAYARRCAVTGERVLPALEAAHIRPYAAGGGHRVTNGILMRRDIHSLFDTGYVTVTTDFHVEVSRRIGEDFNNGREYLRMHGGRILLPGRTESQPERAELAWHNDNVFIG
ncbi:MAG: HNH endonuclease [Minwuiales bacterium]|nr:HNH endonuclease [Minwuiales bacterium]